jgi:predicted phosphodiesterase
MIRRVNVVARAGILVIVLVAMIAGSSAGWPRGWNRVEALWRLDIGAPQDTRLHPFHDADGGSSASAPHTTGDAPLTRVVAAGDVGTGDEFAYRTAEAIDRLESDGDIAALMLLGDSVYPSGDADEVDAKVFDPFGPVLDGPTELVAALGNHDVRTDDGEPLMAALGMPGRWYEREFGPLRVVVVDSTRVDDRGQLDWLERRLSTETDATWTVVLQHHPPFSAGQHGSDAESRELLVPLYEAAGVDLVLSGHDHDYQRSHPQNGVTYVVAGGAAKLRPTGSADFTVIAASTHHFLELAAYRDRLEVRAIGVDDREIGAFELPAAD